MGEQTSSFAQYRNPPIIEAVVDIDCDLPAAFKLPEIEEATAAAFKDRYPIAQTRHMEQYTFTPTPGGPPAQSVRSGIQAFQCFNEDKDQIVQVRAEGFTFNRLQPYKSLDDLLPEIERAWAIYRGLVSPIEVKAIRLRCINRIQLPLTSGSLDFDDYFTIGPRLPGGDEFSVGQFLIQFVVIERATKCFANVRLAPQPPTTEHLPVVLDIEAIRQRNIDVDQWSEIKDQITQLRSLRNRVFEGSIKQTTRELFD